MEVQHVIPEVQAELERAGHLDKTIGGLAIEAVKVE